MKKLVLGSLFFGLFLVGCSSSQPKEEVVVVEEVIVVEPVEVIVLPAAKLDK